LSDSDKVCEAKDLRAEMDQTVGWAGFLSRNALPVLLGRRYLEPHLLFAIGYFDRLAQRPVGGKRRALEHSKL
jgi:hypothetical protein